MSPPPHAYLEYNSASPHMQVATSLKLSSEPPLDHHYPVQYLFLQPLLQHTLLCVTHEHLMMSFYTKVKGLPLTTPSPTLHSSVLLPFTHTLHISTHLTPPPTPSTSWLHYAPSPPLPSYHLPLPLVTLVFPI